MQILAALGASCAATDPSVVANKGYKRYLKAEKGAFAIDLDKARDEEQFDGMWVLRTNTELSAVEVALRYKQLWMVEQVFRTAKCSTLAPSSTKPMPPSAGMSSARSSRWYCATSSFVAWTTLA